MASTSSPAIRIRPPAFTEGKLDGSNYTLWKFKISAILDSYELLDTVLDLDPEPRSTPDPKIEGAILPPDAALLRAWKCRNADALCAIVTSCSDSVLTLIQHTSKAADAWTLLKNQYETRNQTRIQNLENQLAAERLAEGEAAEIFITRIKGLCDQMAAVGIAKTSEELARRCIRVLPQKYDGLVTALNTQIRTPPLTFEEFSSMLLEEELRLKSRDGETSVALTMKTDWKNNNKQRPKKKRFQGSCHYCSKKGHVVKECRKRIFDEKNGTLKQGWKETSNSAEAELELFVACEET